MKRHFFYLLCFLLFFLLPKLNFVFAASNFFTDYNAEYNILETGITNVTYNVTLTNQTSQYYASLYSINVGFKNIADVIAKDSTGVIKSRVVEDGDGNRIELVFGKKVVGVNQKRIFSVSFSTPDIAQKSGRIWDINIPGLSRQNEFRAFNVNVSVPKTLGSPSYIKPNIRTFNEGVFSFTKEELGESGISISFGKEEIYEFDLTYHLENTNLFPIKTEIALPPTTNYQDIVIDDIDPKPLNVIEDQDGNWLGSYILSPTKQLVIKVTGKARISLHPKKQKMSKEKLSLYLKERPFWETSSKKVKELAAKLKTPYDIYSYVVKTLKYDFSRVSKGLPRLGAGRALDNPDSAVCLEFTDLFIALARAAGIPAREINGFAYTQNSKERPLSLVQDILHSWPQYYDYDIESWVMVDPTWGNTTGGVDYFYTLDFNHLAFVIKGANENYPIPAGGYKNQNEKTKDVNVKFAENFSNAKEALSISDNFETDHSSFMNVAGNMLIHNIGNVLSNPQTIKVSTSSLIPAKQEIKFGSIPPFGYLTIPVALERVSALTNKAVDITISINEDAITKSIRISPLAINKRIIIGGILFVIILTLTTIIVNKTRYLPFFRKRG